VSQPDLSAYLPIALMLVVVVGFCVASLRLARVLAPQRPTPEKLEPYECGIVPLQEPGQRFPVKFYLVAMLYVIFDIEIVFLFAWAASFYDLGWYGLAAVGLFTLLLVETLIYVWRRGALDWNLPRRRRYQRAAAAGAERREG
jgi:NADH-quinone oxidoreductase subunit A